MNGVRIDDIVYDGKTALGASFNGKISPLANSRVMPYGGFKRDAQQHNPKETEEVMRQSAIKYAGQQEAIKDFAGRAQKAVVSLAGEAKHQVEAALDGLKTLSKDYQEVKQPASMPASSPVVTPPATGVSSTPVQTGK